MTIVCIIKLLINNNLILFSFSFGAQIAELMKMVIFTLFLNYCNYPNAIPLPSIRKSKIKHIYIFNNITLLKSAFILFVGEM